MCQKPYKCGTDALFIYDLRFAICDFTSSPKPSIRCNKYRTLLSGQKSDCPTCITLTHSSPRSFEIKGPDIDVSRRIDKEKNIRAGTSLGLTLSELIIILSNRQYIIRLLSTSGLYLSRHFCTDLYGDVRKSLLCRNL